MTKTRWLNRRVGPLGPYLALCLTEAEFKAAVSHLKSADVPRWMNRGAHATTHTFEHVDNGTVCVVCIHGVEKRSPIEVAGLIVHEAVHVWQQHCKDIGETRPGDEQEAYSIQLISQALMSDFAGRKR